MTLLIQATRMKKKRMIRSITNMGSSSIMANVELKVYVSNINVYVTHFYGDIFLDNTNQIEMYNIDVQKLSSLCNFLT